MTAPGPKGNGRPAAKDVPDAVMLRAAEAYALGGRFPLDALAGQYPHIPRKVLVAKQRKLLGQGLMTEHWVLTRAGVDVLREEAAS